MIEESPDPAVEQAKILIVDDEPDVIRMLERTLRLGGFTQVRSTTDPFEFMELFEEHSYDLVMVDLAIPGLSGIEILERLAATIPPDDYLPRIVLTGETAMEPRQRALTAGATQFLNKPVDLIEILLRVRGLLTTRMLHQELLQEKRTLEVRVEERTRDLERANEELVDRMEKLLEAQEHRQQAEQQLQHAVKVEALGQLAASVAHDFNNLLAVIMNFAEFASQDVGEDHPAAADIREIQTAARSASMLTRQLLMFSRKETMRPEVLDPDAVIVEMQALLGAALKGRHELVLDLSGNDARVKIDRGHLEQVLMNLAVNARDAMTEAGTLTVMTRVIKDQEAAGDNGPGEHWTLSVTDTGMGMPDEVRSKIFDPFFTTKVQGQGTGLGLATAKRVIERAGGSIAVESGRGAGTTFWISLPVVGAEFDGADELGPEDPRGRGETILVVAEDDVLQRAMERTLRANGYVPMVCSSAGEALEGPLAKGTRPDLLVTDVLAGEMSGVELAKRSCLPALFMSTHAEQVLQESDVLGSDAVLLQKPFEPADLLAHVRRMFVD